MKIKQFRKGGIIMAVLILNGSPKADSQKGNTNRFIHYFTAAFEEAYSVYCIYKEEPKILVDKMKDYDSIIMVMPLYIHAMPSGVKALIDEMTSFESKEGKRKKLGFIVQFGFPEGCHAKWLSDYFECLAKRLNCQYLGTVVKGDCAFIEGQSERYAPLFEKLTKLGKEYEKTGEFNKKLMTEISMPYVFDEKTRKILKVVCKMGIVDRKWKKLQKANNVLKYAKDQPFL